jgi:hypothetical protein
MASFCVGHYVKFTIMVEHMTNKKVSMSTKVYGVTPQKTVLIAEVKCLSRIQYQDGQLHLGRDRSHDTSDSLSLHPKVTIPVLLPVLTERDKRCLSRLFLLVLSFPKFCFWFFLAPS